MLAQIIFKNNTINVFGKAFNYLLQIVLIAYLVKSLGKNVYGVFVLALAIIGTTNLLEAGFGLAVTKYVAEFKAKADFKRLNEIVNTNFIVNTALAVIFASIITVINEFYLGVFFKIPEEILPQARCLIRILIVFSFFEFWNVGFIRVSEGLQNFLIARVMENIKWLFRLIFVIAGLMFDKSLLSVGFAYLLAGIVNFAVLFVFTFNKKTGLKFNLFDCSRKTFKMMFCFSIWIMASKVFALMLYRINALVIGVFLEPVYLAYYSIASKVYELLKYGFSIISSTIVPVASQLSALTDKRRLILLFEKSSFYTIAIMAPFLIFTYFQADRIIELWMAPGFEISVVLIKLFILSLIPTLFVASGCEILVGLNQLKYLVVYGGIGSLISFIINVSFISSFGINTVVFGVIIGIFIMSVGYFYKMIEIFEIDLKSYIKKVLLKPFLLSIFFLCGLWLYRSILVSGFMTILYFIGIYSILDEKEKYLFKEFFKFKKTI